MEDLSGLNWSNNEAVVKAAVPKARLTRSGVSFPNGVGGVFFAGVGSEPWSDARRSPTVVAFEREHNPAMRLGMSGAELIQAERQRQIQVEGWTPGHDDAHETSELLAAALAYTSTAQDQVTVIKNGEVSPDVALARNMDIFWPREWDESWWKPSPPDPIRNLVKAGAVIAAEIDRIQRAQAQSESEVQS